MTKEEEKLINKVAIKSIVVTLILFFTIYIGGIYFISKSRNDELTKLESGLTVAEKSQCSNMAKSQERTVVGRMAVHSSYEIDYEECLVRSAIHKEQYGKEDLIKN
jgi:hypothetical protein